MDHFIIWIKRFLFNDLFLQLSLFLHLSINPCVLRVSSLCVCVCVSVWKRERDIICVLSPVLCVFEWVCVCAVSSLCVCVYMRKRECVHVRFGCECVSVCVKERERESMCRFGCVQFVPLLLMMIFTLHSFHFLSLPFLSYLSNN